MAQKGDFAFNEDGDLGLIELTPDDDQITVLWKDGSTSKAYRGIYLTMTGIDRIDPYSREHWLAREPIVVGSLAELEARLVSWRER